MKAGGYDGCVQGQIGQHVGSSGARVEGNGADEGEIEAATRTELRGSRGRVELGLWT